MKINPMLDKFSSSISSKTKVAVTKNLVPSFRLVSCSIVCHPFRDTLYSKVTLLVRKRKKETLFSFHRICYSIPKWNKPTRCTAQRNVICQYLALITVSCGMHAVIKERHLSSKEDGHVVYNIDLKLRNK